MASAFQQVGHFLSMGRGDLALRLLPDLLAVDPTNPTLLTWLSAAKCLESAHEEGLEAAERALEIEADSELAHYYRCINAYHLDRLKELKESAKIHMDLAPNDPDSWYLKAIVGMQEHRLKDVVHAADQGLQLDPEHDNIIHVRTQALMALGRTEESIEQVDSALGRDPEDSVLHASKGWNLLQQGKRRDARDHLREALRLDPGNEYARQGLIECLRAMNPIYALLLKLMFFVMRFPPKQRVTFFIVLYFGSKIVSRTFRDMPGWEWLGYTVFGLYLLFALMSFFAEPITDLMLLLSRDGRLALQKPQKRNAALLGGLILSGCALFLAAYFVSDGARAAVLMFLGIASIMSYVPAHSVWDPEVGKKRGMLLKLMTAGIAIAMCTSLGLLVFGSSDAAVQAADSLALGALVAAALCTWFAG